MELEQTTAFVDQFLENELLTAKFYIPACLPQHFPEALKNKLLKSLTTICELNRANHRKLNRKDHKETASMIGYYREFPLLKSALPEIICQRCFEPAIQNLDFHLSSLIQARAQILVIFRDFFHSLDEATLREYHQTLLNTIKKAHIAFAEPLYNRFQLIFGLAKLAQDHRFNLTEESFVGNDEEPTLMQPLADYLGLAGLEQILEKVMKAKRKPVPAAVAPAELRMADLSPAVSQQALKPAPREEPAPQPVAKVKKRGQAPAQSALAAAAPTKKEEVLTEELAQFKTNANERRKVLAMLLEAGFKIRREGGRHTILAHSQAGQFPLPRHGILSAGVVQKATQAAGAGAGKKDPS